MKNTMNFLTYCDGRNDMIDISNLIDASIEELTPIAEKFLNVSLIEENS
jgi:aminopeptidase-like protein